MQINTINQLENYIDRLQKQFEAVPNSILLTDNEKSDLSFIYTDLIDKMKSKLSEVKSNKLFDNYGTVEEKIHTLIFFEPNSKKIVEQLISDYFKESAYPKMFENFIDFQKFIEIACNSYFSFIDKIIIENVSEAIYLEEILSKNTLKIGNQNRHTIPVVAVCSFSKNYLQSTLQKKCLIIEI